MSSANILQDIFDCKLLSLSLWETSWNNTVKPANSKIMPGFFSTKT